MDPRGPSQAPRSLKFYLTFALTPSITRHYFLTKVLRSFICNPHNFFFFHHKGKVAINPHNFFFFHHKGKVAILLYLLRCLLQCLQLQRYKIRKESSQQKTFKNAKFTCFLAKSGQKWNNLGNNNKNKISIFRHICNSKTLEIILS